METTGGLSFLPSMFYTLFLTSFLMTYVLPSFSAFIEIPVKYLLFLFIPMIILSNDLASLLGVTYGTVPSTTDPSQKMMNEIR